MDRWLEAQFRTQMSISIRGKPVESVEPGIYRHFKDKKYRVVGCAQHSETGEIFVIYHEVLHPDSLQVRPRSMFVELVDKDGLKIPRFTLISGDAKTRS